MDNEGALQALVEGAARARGLGVDTDALDWIVDRLGGDRGQSRSEIEKLLLYKEGDGSSSVSLDDALDRVFAEGGNAVQLVRALQRHVDQLHLVAGHAAKGGSLESAMFKARGLA